MTQPIMADVEEQLAIPPRFRWLRRFAIAAAIVVCGLVLLRLVVGVYANRRYEKLLADYKKRGEPVTAEDLAADDIAESENAAHYLQRASATLQKTSLDSPRSSVLEYGAAPPFPAEWWRLAQMSYNAHGPAFADARLARGKAKSAFPRQLNSPVVVNVTRWYNAQRHLGNILADAALYLHLLGNDAEAIEMMFDLVRQGDAIIEEPFLVSGLVGRGIRALGVSNVMQIAPGLSMTEQARGLQNPAKRAPRERIKAMIAQLLDAEAEKRAARRTMITERVIVIDSAINGFGQSLLLRPVIQLEIDPTLRDYDPLLRACTADTWPEAQQILKQQRANHQDAGPLSSGTVLAVLLPGLDRAVQTDFRIRMQCRAAAVSLAAQLFRMDNGRWPTTLEELTPEYLPSVPGDPMAADGGAMRYLILGNRPLVYSAGEDGAFYEDPAGAVPAGPQYGWQVNRSGDKKRDDQYFDLSRFTPPPATQPDSP